MRTVVYDGRPYEVSDAHPAADALPWHTDRPEFAALVADMRAHGFDPDRPCVKHSVTGLLIDGRRRELAAAVAGVEPVFDLVRWDDQAVVERVRREHLHRRNLSASERAAAAVDLAALYPHGGDRRSDQAETFPLETQAALAAGAAVSDRTIRDAAKVRAKAPELFESVKEGRLDAHVAAQVASLPAADRERVAAAPDPRAAGKEAVAAAKGKPVKKSKRQERTEANVREALRLSGHLRDATIARRYRCPEKLVAALRAAMSAVSAPPADPQAADSPPAPAAPADPGFVTPSMFTDATGETAVEAEPAAAAPPVEAPPAVVPETTLPGLGDDGGPTEIQFVMARDNVLAAVRSANKVRACMTAALDGPAGRHVLAAIARAGGASWGPNPELSALDRVWDSADVAALCRQLNMAADQVGRHLPEKSARRSRRGRP